MVAPLEDRKTPQSKPNSVSWVLEKLERIEGKNLGNLRALLVSNESSGAQQITDEIFDMELSPLQEAEVAANCGNPLMVYVFLIALYSRKQFEQISTELIDNPLSAQR